MSSINKNSIYLSLSNALNSFINLGLSIALARLFGDKKLFGEFFQLFLIINFMLAMTSGIPLGLNYFFGKYVKFTDRYFLLRRLFYFILGVAIVAGLMTFFGISFLADKFDNNLFLELVYFFIILLFFKLINSFFANFSLLSKNIKYYFRTSLVIFVLVLVFISLSFAFDLEYKNILLGLTVIEVVRFVLMTFKLPKYILVKPFKQILSKKKESFYIGSITGVALLNTANIYLDKYMISFLLDAESYAEYQVGSSTIPFITIISGSIITALIPEFSRLFNSGEVSKMVSLWRGATKEITFLLIPIFVFCIFFGKDIIISFYGMEYEYSGFLFQIYSIRFIGSVVLFSLTMGAIGLQNWVFINSLIGLGINFVLNYFLIQKYGVLGAVLATIISTYIGFLICVSILRFKTKIGFKDYFPVKFYMLVVVIATIVALLMKTIPFLNYNIFAIAMKAFCFYVLVLLVSDKISKEPIPIMVKLKEKIKDGYSNV